MGKKIIGNLFAVLFFAAASYLQAAQLTVNVADSDGNPLVGVEVFAVEFTTNGVGPNTKVLTTVTGGTTIFSNLKDGVRYEVGASSQAYFPTLREQLFDWNHPSFDGQGSGTINITLNTDANRPVGWFQVQLTSAVGLGCFGLRREGLQEDISLTIANVDANGDGFANYHNIPTESFAYTYEASGFSNNLSVSSRTTTAIVDGARYDLALNFDPSLGNALPPNRDNSSANAQGGAVDDGAYVDGIIQSTYTNPSTGQPYYVPWSWVNLKIKDPNSNNFYQRAWANADQNGRFRVYGLETGATYYLEVGFGCTWGGNSVCFEGYSSTVTQPNSSTSTAYAPGFNDFIYRGGVQVHKVQLQRVEAGSGQMRIGVQDSKGRAIPNSFINLWPDWTSWHVVEDGNACDGQNHWQTGVDVSSPALGNTNIQATTGYTLITGLRPGNYAVQVWTQFSNNGIMYNAGADRQWDWNSWNTHKGCLTSNSSTSADDLRVAIATFTNSLGDNLFVYNGSGTAVSVTSLTIIVPTLTNSGAVIRGKLKFPNAVDLRSNPITLTMQKNCSSDSSDPNCWRGGGFDVVPHSDQEASFLSEYDYEINVTTGKFWFQIQSDYWGVVKEHGGSDQVELIASTTAVKDYNFVQAGRVRGNIYKPDGSKFIPGDTGNGYVGGNINANGENSYGWAQMANDGSYVIGGLAPGDYTLRGDIWGSGGSTLTNPEDRPEVTVVANTDVTADVKFVNAEAVRFTANTSNLPPLKNVKSQWGEFDGEHWRALRFPGGTVLDSAKITEMMVGEEDDWDKRIVQKTTTSTNSYPCQSSFKPVDYNWCPLLIPTGNIHDFYFVRYGDMYGWSDHGEAGGPIGGSQFYFTIINSTKNFRIDSGVTHSTSVFKQAGPQTSTITAIPLNMTPPGAVDEGAVLRGKLTAVNIIREQDFKQFGGDFNKFVAYLPVVIVRDSNKNLLGAGMATPVPDELVPNAANLENAVQSNNWPAYSTLVSTAFPSGFIYEIRGLPAGQKIFASLTTPNYPPQFFEETLGNLGSTTTKDFDLDALGAGASVTGVVSATSTAIIPGAAVTIESSAYPVRKVVVSSTGSYRFDGLPAGTFRVKASAGGYQTAQEFVTISAADQSAGASKTTNLTLNISGAGLIHGTVYRARIPFAQTQPGVKVSMYNETNRKTTSKPIVMLDTLTSTTGYYRFEGLTVGDEYTLFVNERGKQVINVTTVAVASPGAIVDLDSVPGELDFDLFVRQETDAYKFLAVADHPDFIFSASNFQAWIATSPFDSQASTISVTFGLESAANSSKKIMKLEYPRAPIDATNGVWVLRVIARGTSGKRAIKEILFGKNIPLYVRQPIGDILLGQSGNNEVKVDSSGLDPTSLAFSVGAASGTNATATLTSVSTSAGTGGAGLGSASYSPMDKLTSLSGTFKGNIYDIVVSSVNFTGKPITIKIAYDRTALGNTDPGSLVLSYYNSTTQSWGTVSGASPASDGSSALVADINPLSVVSGLSQGEMGHATLALMGQRAPASRRTASNSLSSNTGSFAVVVNASSSSVAASGYRQYNFPNPFNLKSKTVTLRSGVTSVPTTITGTYIVIAPTGSGTPAYTIRIYNLAGDQVRVLEGTAAAGVYNYVEWDGKNTSGENVASGVYFAVVDTPGSDKKKPIKLVVVK